MKTKLHKCQRLECTKDAVYSVHLSLRVHEDHEPAVSTPILFVCEDHKYHITWDNFVEPNWNKICKSLESVGRVAPVKKFSKLILKPLTNGIKIKGGSDN